LGFFHPLKHFSLKSFYDGSNNGVEAFDEVPIEWSKSIKASDVIKGLGNRQTGDYLSFAGIHHDSFLRNNIA
jgi:hypothetical protein